MTGYGVNTFSYGADGVRISKNNKSYIYDGDKLLSEKWGTKEIRYIYGMDGIIGFEYEGNAYYYKKNLQGDVIEIVKYNRSTESSSVAARYVYDAYGNHKIIYDSEGIGTLNPIRYRSYYYDVETGLYYLQTRYYDPELGRFISQDNISNIDPLSINGLNLFAYCLSNPVMFKCDNISNGVTTGKAIKAVSKTTSSNRPQSTVFDWVVDCIGIHSSISGLYTALTTIAYNAGYFYKNVDMFKDDMALLGVSPKNGVLGFNGFSWKLSKGDIFSVVLGVGLDIYDSIQRGVSTGGVILGASLTAAKSIGLIYLNKGILNLSTAIGSAICPGVGTVVGFIIGSIICLVIDIKVSELTDGLIDEIAR